MLRQQSKPVFLALFVSFIQWRAEHPRFKENELKETASMWKQTETDRFWVADREHGLRARLINMNIFYVQIYITVAADGRLSAFSPLIFKWWSLHSIHCTFTRIKVDMAASSKSCSWICRIWLAHRDIHIAFCRQSTGRWLYDSWPLVQWRRFRLILLLLGTGKYSCLGQIGVKHIGTPSVKHQRRSYLRFLCHGMKMGSDKVCEQI